MLRVLYVSDLYPCAARPLAGSFHLPVFDRLDSRCEIKVIMPVMVPLGLSSAGQPLLSASTDPRVVARPAVHYLPGASALNGYLFARAVAKPLAELLSHWRPDVVLSSFLYPAASGTLRQTQRYRLPLVADAIGSDVNVLLAQWWLRNQVLRVAREARHLITRSQALRSRLMEVGIPPAKMTVLYNGVDQELFRPCNRDACAAKLNLALEPRRVFFAGLFTPIKNVSTLISAFAQVHNTRHDVELILAGSGPLRAQLADQIRALGLETVVRFTPGFLPHDQIPIWLNAADVLCLPSLNEGVPNIVLEALACGVPVVTSQVGGIPEVVPESAGILVRNPRDANELATALLSALSRQWDRNAIRQAVAAFTWETAADQMYEILTNATHG